VLEAVVAKDDARFGPTETTLEPGEMLCAHYSGRQVRLGGKVDNDLGNDDTKNVGEHEISAKIEGRTGGGLSVKVLMHRVGLKSCPKIQPFLSPRRTPRTQSDEIGSE
jgi:hypothetical protein